jgi:DHA2 family multidrug resistance protein
MMTRFSVDMDSWPIITSGVIQGLGIGFAVMPLNLVTFTTLAPRLRTDGAALYSLVRNIGGSIGISLMTALLARNLQTNHSELAGALDPTLQQSLRMGVLEQLGASAQAAFAMVDAEINRQASMIAYIDDYWLMMWSVVLTMPLIMVMRRPGRRPATPEPAVDLGH